MIIEKLENINHYKNIGNDIRKAFDFLLNTDMANLNEGKHDIDGEDIFALVSNYNTKNREDCFPEAHKKYIDVQYVAEGEELVGYAPLNGQKIKEDYKEEKDFMLFDTEPSFIKFEKGMFAVFYPCDLHMPGIKAGCSSHVKKIVIKVRVKH